MAKILSCRDVGVDCDFTARGNTEKEVLEKAAEHAKTDHGIGEVTEDYIESWRKLIREEK